MQRVEEFRQGQMQQCLQVEAAARRHAALETDFPNLTAQNEELGAVCNDTRHGQLHGCTGQVRCPSG